MIIINSIETIMIMARALAKAGHMSIVRLDIQYSSIEESYTGHCVLSDVDGTWTIEYCIHDNGTIEEYKK